MNNCFFQGFRQTCISTSPIRRGRLYSYDYIQRMKVSRASYSRERPCHRNKPGVPLGTVIKKVEHLQEEGGYVKADVSMSLVDCDKQNDIYNIINIHTCVNESRKTGTKTAIRHIK